MKPTLYSISYSPWSIKARWALHHHGVEYRKREYLPMLGAPELKLRARRLGRVTVPVLLADGEVFDDSFAIAKYAERVGDGAPLGTERPEVAEWNRRADQVAAAGRARTTRRVANDAAARRENIPPLGPKFLRPALLPMVGLGVRFLVGKYDLDATADAEAEREMGLVLEEARGALNGGDHLLDAFSYADMALVAALQFIEPHEKLARFGPANRAAWTAPAVAERFRDVLDWRDRVVAERDLR